MRFVTIALSAVIVITGISVPSARAAYCGITSAANRGHRDHRHGRVVARRAADSSSKSGDCASGDCASGDCTCASGGGDVSCYTVMQTRTRVIYEQVTEEQQHVVFDTVLEEQTVQEVKRFAEVEYRQEQFTYQRPVYETITQQVPYTVQRPFVETQTCEVPYTTYARSYETRVRSVPYTVHNTVSETTTQTVYYRVPREVCYTETIQVPTGHWETRVEEYPCESDQEMKGAQKQSSCGKGGTIKVCRRVWVPGVETKEVSRTKTVYDLKSMEVPRTVNRLVREVRTRDVEYTVCRLAPVTQFRTVSYQVVRSTTEQRMRTVSCVVEKMITEVGTRNVPYTNYREVPVTRTVTVPRQVPRTVTTTVTRCVPRTETYQVPVKVYVPSCQGDPGKKGGSMDGPMDEEPGEVPAPSIDDAAPPPTPEPDATA